MIKREEVSENLRVYHVGNNKLRVQRKNPYGFWVMSFERGQLPKMLEGQYTSADEAIKKVNKYLEEKSK